MSVPKKKLTKFFFPFIAEEITIENIKAIQVILEELGEIDVQFLTRQTPYFWATFLGKRYPDLKAVKNRLSKSNVCIIWIIPENGETFLENYKKFKGKVENLIANQVNVLMPLSIKNWDNMCHFMLERPEIFNINIKTIPVI